MTVAHVYTIAFAGIEAREVDVQVQMGGGGLPAFNIVGLPPERITVNLAPADLPKEGSHFDLPIALGLLVVMGVVPADVMSGFTALGELALDGAIAPVVGVLNAGPAAGKLPACGPEEAWAGGIRVWAPPSLIALINHFKGTFKDYPPP